MVVNIFYLRVSVGREIRSSLAGWFGWGAVVSLYLDGTWGRSHLKCRRGLEGSVPSWLTQRAGRFVKLCWRWQISVPSHMNLSWGCWRVFTTWQLASPRPRDPRRREQEGSHSVFYELASEVILRHFCDTLLVTQVSPMQAEGWGSLRPAQRLPSTLATTSVEALLTFA